MALLKITTTAAQSLGALAATRVFTAKRGSFAISTDSSAADEDCFVLSEGMSLTLSTGLSVSYRAVAFGAVNGVGQPESWLHHMPV